MKYKNYQGKHAAGSKHVSGSKYVAESKHVSGSKYVAESKHTAGSKHVAGSKRTAGGRRTHVWLKFIPAALILISLIAVGNILLDRLIARLDYRQMAETVHEAEEIEATSTEKPLDGELEVPGTEAATGEDTKETVTILEQYQQWYDENPEMVGWLSIEDTAIDYPVMHTPDDPEKYLYKNFQGKFSYPGVPFVDYRCKADSDNLIIHGHNMPDGTMFHTLMAYDEKEYWQEHPTIRFDSLYEKREYEVVAAFYDRVYYTHETDFKFYNFIDAKNEADYNSAVEKLREKSIYDTGVVPEYGQQLIMLVTCTYQTENGRFVVLACEKQV